MSLDRNHNSNYSPYNLYQSETDPGYYNSQQLPALEDAVPVSEQLRPSPFNAHTNELFRVPKFGMLDPGSDGDYMTNTIIIQDQSNNFQEESLEPGSLDSLPPQLRDLITEIDSLSKPLSLNQKLILSQQLTRLSYSLQTSCLCPVLTEMSPRSPRFSPTPPPQVVPKSAVPSSPIMSRPAVGSDWIGPGHALVQPKRPGQINLMNSPVSPKANTMPSLQYDSRNLASEVIYVNTSGSPSAAHAPPLPPRDPTYQNCVKPHMNKPRPID